MNNNSVSIRMTSTELKIKERIIREHIEEGHIILDSTGRVPIEIFNQIKKQKEKYVSVREFLESKTNERFNATNNKHRNKYEWYLEENNYFGAQRHEPNEFLFCSHNDKDYYFSQKDIQTIEYESNNFFKFFGLKESEKIEKIATNKKHEHINTEKYLLSYKNQLFSDNEPSPSFSSFVEIIYELPDVLKITDADIKGALSKIDHNTQETRRLFINFLIYVSEREKTHYSQLLVKTRKDFTEIPAYSYESLCSLATVFFNEEYSKKQNMLEKALANPRFAEMWLYHCCHFICGWRGADICDKWIYPQQNGLTDLGIDIINLRNNIESDLIDPQELSRVANYCVKRIEMGNMTTGKTQSGHLRIFIHPNLQPFFGKLILIAEYHHLKNGNGYMNSSKMSKYNLLTNCKQFYGTEIKQILNGYNIESRRLNKSFLQSIERAATDIGNSTLTAHVIASFARNHCSINTTVRYLRDGKLTGETAELTAFLMLERGTFSFMKHNLLASAFPDSFGKASEKNKTETMKLLGSLNSYNLELESYSNNAADTIKKNFAEGINTAEVIKIMREMVAFSNGKGEAKDPGIYCERLALGYDCENPSYKSCLANVCPFHVFTKDGLPALIDVVNDYIRKAKKDTKYETVLNQVIIPSFKSILTDILRQSSKEEKERVLIAIEENIND